RFGFVRTQRDRLSRARLVIWLVFAFNLLVVIAIVIGDALPGAPFWSATDQEAYHNILGQTPRILLASFVAYLIGEFANSYVLARLKIATRGRWLWSRTIGSTLVGEGLDSLVFITIAFAGLPNFDLTTAILTQWTIKVLYEVAATPLTYLVVGYLKWGGGIGGYGRE